MLSLFLSNCSPLQFCAHKVSPKRTGTKRLLTFSTDLRSDDDRIETAPERAMRPLPDFQLILLLFQRSCRQLLRWNNE